MGKEKLPLYICDVTGEVLTDQSEMFFVEVYDIGTDSPSSNEVVTSLWISKNAYPFDVDDTTEIETIYVDRSNGTKLVAINGNEMSILTRDNMLEQDETFLKKTENVISKIDSLDEDETYTPDVTVTINGEEIDL